MKIKIKSINSLIENLLNVTKCFKAIFIMKFKKKNELKNRKNKDKAVDDGWMENRKNEIMILSFQRNT